jgi:hypothetical protein
MLRITKTLKISLFLLVIAALFMAACSSTSTPRPTSTSTVTAAATAAQVEQPSPTPEPSPTAEAGKVWLVSVAPDPAGVQSLLQGLSQQAGLQFETRADLQPADLSTGARVVIFLTPPANLNDLLAAAPQAQFVVVSPTDLNPAANLSVIRQRIENQAFLGGFISVLLSNDWRAGGLLPADGPLGGLLQDAFINGGHYFCGVCSTGWPLISYPVVTSLPSASDGPAWQTAGAGLFDTQKVEVYYISPEAARAEVLDDLAGKVQFETTVTLVGGQTPPETIRSQWAATVTFDLAGPLQQIWPDVLAGKGGAALEAPLKLEDVNPDLLGAGRQRLANELMDEIAAGRVSPYSVAP